MASHPGQIPAAGLRMTSPMSEGETWSGNEYQSGGGYGNESPSGSKSPQQASSGNPGYLKGFSGVQNKVTRDGQPAKRRGPKPDSKPAQTRRQELNRQAQRTHRERKEQYIKALEQELSRLREAYVHDSGTANNAVNQHKLLLREQQQENLILRDILASRGVPFETELETRKASLLLRPRRGSSSIGTVGMNARSAGFAGLASAPSSVGYSPMHDQRYANGASLSSPGHSPGTARQSHSPPGPDVQEYSIKQEQRGVPDLPGIFEKDPQLGVEFVLALEATCRDHGEYLVRRSVSSPDEPEQALFSGHALMASCPPPTHIAQVPAQGGGLIATYPHQMPELPHGDLSVLLNLSQKIKADGVIEGGQVTPIMALASLRGHPNYKTLTRDDVVGMIETIRNKVRCYGFGAVMEDFELRDVLWSLFATKPETYETFGNEMTDEVEGMYS